MKLLYSLSFLLGLSLSLHAQVATPIVINEFLASNDATQADQDGEFDDWVELYNLGADDIDMSGYFLSDDFATPEKWTFPAGAIIPAGGYLIVWADDDEEQDGLHAPFKLSAGGEQLMLTRADGLLIDSLTFPEQTTDVSYGRFPNGTGRFGTMTPTFGAMNSGTSTLEPLAASALTLSPNPARDFLNLRVGADFTENLVVTLINERGQQLRTVRISGAGSTRRLELRDLPGGLYFVGIRNAAGTAQRTERIVVRR